MLCPDYPHRCLPLSRGRCPAGLGQVRRVLALLAVLVTLQLVGTTLLGDPGAHPVQVAAVGP